MKRFILTGAPGAGKTEIIRHLQLGGFRVVAEAATDLIIAAQAQGIAEPWHDPQFVEAIAREQKEREAESAGLSDEVQFYDRSVVCTAALAVYMGHAFPPFLISELDRITKERVYERQVFFVTNLGFVIPTGVRRITFKECLRFEEVHERTYRDFGFEVLYVGPGSVAERAKIIKSAVSKLNSSKS